jgi:hypothetical protein
MANPALANRATTINPTIIFFIFLLLSGFLFGLVFVLAFCFY